jgi:hypothetical protein
MLSKGDGMSEHGTHGIDGTSKTNSEPVEAFGHAFAPKQVIYCDCGCVWGIIGLTEDGAAIRLMLLHADAHDGDDGGAAGEIVTSPITHVDGGDLESEQRSSVEGNRDENGTPCRGA